MALCKAPPAIIPLAPLSARPVKRSSHSTLHASSLDIPHLHTLTYLGGDSLLRCTDISLHEYASLHCRASSRLPARSQVRPAWPAAPVGSQPGHAWLQVAVRLSRTCCCRPAGRQQPSASGVGWWRWGQW